jgi:hypothetical protein
MNKLMPKLLSCNNDTKCKENIINTTTQKFVDCLKTHPIKDNCVMIALE